MTDSWSNYLPSLDSPAEDGVIVEPSATALAQVTRAVILTTGVSNVTFLGRNGAGGNTVALTAGVTAPAGQPFPIRITHFLATGTTATGLLALW